jgi:hypothetical protein
MAGKPMIIPVDARNIGLRKEQLRDNIYCNRFTKHVLSTYPKTNSGINIHIAGGAETV